MKNRHLLLALTASTVILTGCQNLAPAKGTANTKPASAHQYAHGASAADRAEFIDEYGGDQTLSKTQFDKARAARFNAMDANHNSVVDEQEYVDEYAIRLEKNIGDERKAQVNQTVIRFGAVDKNDDGKITPDEFAASGDILFTFLDKTKSGVINLKTPEPEADDNIDRSVLAMPSTHTVKGFLEIYDLDGNNEVTRANFDAQRDEKFRFTDTNHDGWLSSEEYLLEFENRLDYQAKQVRASQIKQAHVRFNALDADKNAALTLQEFTASGDRIFNGWDLNKDGWINEKDPLPERKKHDAKDTADHSPK